MPTPWALERRAGTAQELHDLDLDGAVGRVLRWNQVEDAALVVGSAQPASSIDVGGVEAAGLTLARRRSGGGAVLLVPGSQVWVDVFLPAGDEWWCDDVDRSAWWLGDVWVETLESLRPELRGRLRVHRAPSSDPTSGRVACFASVGPGEVVLDDRKLVGISQRRTRHWARFQCVVQLRWDAGPILGALSSSATTPEVIAGLARVASLDDGPSGAGASGSGASGSGRTGSGRTGSGRTGSGSRTGQTDEWSVVEAFHSQLPD